MVVIDGDKPKTDCVRGEEVIIPDEPEAVVLVIQAVIGKIKELEVNGARGKTHSEIARTVIEARALAKRSLLHLSDDTTKYLNAMLKATEDVSGANH